MSENLPTTGLKQCVWRLQHRQTKQYSRGGASTVIKLGEPFWRTKFEFENMTDANFRALTSFIARREGARVSFWAYRPDREVGLNYAAGATATVSVAGDVATFDADQNQNLELGDMVSYDDVNGARFVGEVTEIISAAGLGVTQVRTIPSVVAEHATTPNALIEAAYGEFTLEPDSVTISEPYDITKRISFEARQVEP